MFFSSGPDIGDPIEKLIPTLWPFLISLAAFIVLFIAVFFLAYKPIKKFLKKRNEYIKKNIDESRENNLQSIDTLNDAKDKLTKANAEAKDIVKQAKELANSERAAIIETAKEDAKKEMLKAKEEIKAEVKKNEENIKHEMIDIALLASSKILEREVNKEDNEKRVNDFIKDLNKDN